MILAVDLGTTVTKAALCTDAAVLVTARRSLVTAHRAPDRHEQDPRQWWDAFRAVVAELAAVRPDAWRALHTLVFSAARETFACFDAELEPLGPGILWSDQRGDAAAVTTDPAGFLVRTGVVPNAASTVAKLLAVARAEPARFATTRWVLAPRDWIVARLTGTVATDVTLASRTGCWATDGSPVVDEPFAARLPEPLASTTRFALSPTAASEVGLPADLSVMLGAGDRACEVLGTGATATAPMVSWGTTANLSVPVDALPARPTVPVSRGARDGWLVEMGLSAAGSAVAWLARLTGRGVSELWADAERVPTGADGVLALPWFAGARAPWWRADALATFSGLAPRHDAATLARAVVEGVAFDVARSLERVAPTARALHLAGSGVDHAVWRRVLAAATDRPVRRRRHADAALVGAWLLALEDPTLVEVCNPVVGEEPPDPADRATLRGVRVASDRIAAALLHGGNGPSA